LGTFSYQTSSGGVEIRSTRRSSRVILSPFYTKWVSSAIEREDTREEFRKKRFDEAEEIANGNMGASNTFPSIFSVGLSKVYCKTHECRVFLKNRNKFVLQMYAVSVLLFLVARKASCEQKLKCTYYFSSIFVKLLKLSTICKPPLHGPRNYVDRTWERSANYSARTFLVPVSTPTTVSKILANSPTIFRFLPLSKKINPHILYLQLSISRCGSIVRKTN